MNRYCIHCGVENKKENIICRACGKKVNEIDELVKDYFIGEVEGNAIDSILDFLTTFLKKHLYGVVLTVSIVGVVGTNLALKEDSLSVVDSVPESVVALANEEQKDLYSGTLQVGNYTLRYGTYEGKESVGGTDGTGTSIVASYDLRNDGTYTYTSSRSTKEGVYKVTDTDLYSLLGIYPGRYGVQFDGGTILSVPSNDVLEYMYGGNDRYFYKER